MSTTEVPSKPVSAEPGSLVMFVVASLVVVGGLSLAAAHAPARIRLLGLFSLAFGLLCGGLLSRLAGQLNVPMRTDTLAMIGLMTLAGLIGCICQTVSLQPIPKPPASAHPLVALVETQLGKAETPPPSVPSFGDRFHSYLIQRVSMMGTWNSPWPELFWAFELVMATAGSVGIAIWCRSREVAS